MDEIEALGKLNYETYMTSEYTKQSEYIQWEHLSERDRRAWIAGAQAVGEHIWRSV